MNKKDKNGIVLLDRVFLRRAFIVSVILLLISAIFRNPLLAVTVVGVWPMIGVAHLINYFLWKK
ncbi:MAG TPA: hypothetical protein VFD03_07250 [Clostridia bacterium]|nr:hypothetical protein [Clostridia bacterium]